MRGIRFEIPNQYGSYLAQMLEGIPVENYFWTVDNEKIYNEGVFKDISIFPSNFLSGENFMKSVESPSYYVIFAYIKAFESEKDRCEIASYDDFLSSNCKLALFVVDVSFIDIYSKDRAIIDAIKSNALKYNFKNIQYITEENDRFKKSWTY